jgi:hypothetical protein
VIDLLGGLVDRAGEQGFGAQSFGKASSTLFLRHTVRDASVFIFPSMFFSFSSYSFNLPSLWIYRRRT